MGHHDEYDRDYSGGGHGSHEQQALKTGQDLRDQYNQNLRSVSNIQFDTDDKGNTSIMGISVPKNIKPLIELGLENFKPMLIDRSDKIFENASKLASRLPFAKAHANKIGIVAENTFRWGIIGAKQIFDMVHASSKYSKERSELFNTFSPVMQATGSNARSNEVFRTAFNDVHSDWVSDMKNMAAELPTLVPMVILGLQDQAIAAKRRDAAKNKTYKSQAQSIVKDMEESLNNRVSKAANEKLTAARELTAELVAEREALIKSKLAEGDMRVVEAQDMWLTRPGNEPGETKYIFDEAARAQIEKGEKVKVDRNYFAAKYELPSNQDVMRMVEGQFAHEHQQENGGKEVHKDEQQEKTDKMLRWAIPFASLLTQAFKANFENTAEQRKKRVKAWKMIEHLKKEMESECGKINGRGGRDYSDCDRTFSSKSADEITIEGMGNSEGERVSLKDYITSVFQQHERDREPSRNFRDKNGKLIDPLKGTLLTNLQPAIDLIADRIADGSLSPDALYKLVGENKIIVHGPRGAKTFANEAQVKQVIEKELLPVLSTREVVKMEEFMAKFADPALIGDTLKKNLESMKGSEKALFASLFPDDILEQAGIKKKDIVALRKQAHQFSYDFVAANVLHFASKEPEVLKNLGVSEQEIQAITNLAERIEAGDVKDLNRAVDGRDKAAIDAIRTAGLLEQTKGGEQSKTYWADRVKEMGAAHQKLKENAKKFTDESESRKGDDDQRYGDDHKWSDKKKKHGSEREKENSWGDEESSSRDFSSRFDPERGKDSATDRVRKGRGGSDDSHDMRVS